VIFYLFEFDFSSSNTTNFVIKVTRRKNVTLVPDGSSFPDDEPNKIKEQAEEEKR